MALRTFVFDRPHRRIFRWDHYLEIFERHLARQRAKTRPLHVMEIGLGEGGSTQMWNDFFVGPGRVHLYGVDNRPEALGYEKLAPNVKVFIGDQGDRRFLESLVKATPPLDVVIDDGGHTMQQQIATFDVLYPHVAPDGVYICEDLHTSYWPKYGGQLRGPSTMVEYMKGKIDKLHAYHNQLVGGDMPVDDFTRQTDSMTFYDSVVVLEKRPRTAPRMISVGG